MISIAFIITTILIFCKESGRPFIPRLIGSMLLSAAVVSLAIFVLFVLWVFTGALI